jgi:hypothetical protein
MVEFVLSYMCVCDSTVCSLFHLNKMTASPQKKFQFGTKFSAIIDRNWIMWIRSKSL